MFNYKTISEKENIKDKDIAKIIDYFERHNMTVKKSLPIHVDGELSKEYKIDYFCGEYHLDFSQNKVYIYKDVFCNTEDYPTKRYRQLLVYKSFIRILSENLSGIYGSLKNIEKDLEEPNINCR